LAFLCARSKIGSKAVASHQARQRPFSVSLNAILKFYKSSQRKKMRPNPAVAGRCAIRPRNAGDFYGLGVSIVKTQLSNQQSITLNPISHAVLVC
jgi:hypothetical protein